MELTPEQKTAVTRWVSEGLQLPEIQKRLAEEFKLTLTFMEARLLLIELGLQVREPAAARSAPPPNLSAPEPPREKRSGLFGRRLEPAAPAGGVQVELDRVTQPGAVVSGRVTFSDGVNASWSLDQMGRLRLDAGTPGYRPSDQDVREFQTALNRELERHGF